MFTRLLVGLDGSPNADEALEQAVHLGLRFKAKLVVVHVKETHRPGQRASDSGALLQRAEERVKDAGLLVETILKHGDPDTELAALAHDVDTVLVGRRGRTSPADVLGRTVRSLIRIAERSVIVCGSKPSPMQSCAIAYDGRETSQRALALVARFASVTHSTVHVIHATVDPSIGTMVIGEAEAMLSLQGVGETIRWLNRFLEDSGWRPHVVDLGGGLGVPTHPDERAPSIRELVETITRDLEIDAQLILEPRRSCCTPTFRWSSSRDHAVRPRACG